MNHKRKFKCIGVRESLSKYWKFYFKVGKIYEEYKEATNQDAEVLCLIGGGIYKLNWLVDADQFEEIG